MVRAYTSLRIPGPDRLPLRLQHIWEDRGERPPVNEPQTDESRGHLESVRIVEEARALSAMA